MIGVIVSTFALFVKAIRPATVQIIIEGKNMEISQIPNVFMAADTAIIGVSAFVLGASIVILLMNNYESTSTEPLTDARLRWREVSEKLTNDDERHIYRLVMEADGTIFQGQLVEESGFSKSKVSLVLDRLEARRLLERRRHGMSNAVILK